MFRLQCIQADKLSVQPYLIRFLRRFMNLMLLLSVGLGESHAVVERGIG